MGTCIRAWATPVFEQRMSMLEGGVGAVATASVHAAQFMVITNCCSPGQNFVSTSWLYGGTYNQFRVYMKKFNIDNTRAVYIETISNPKHSVPDIAAISAVAHKHGIPVIVDNTFGMGGYLSRPLVLGADIVTHSCTKRIGRHGTSMGGIVIDGGHFDWSTSGKFPGFTEPADGYHGMRFWETYGYKALSAKLRMDSMRDLGPCMSPFNAWLFLQGLETLALRGKRHCESTLALAEWFEAHPSVNWVLYPRLRWHSHYEHVKEVMPNGGGGVLTFGVLPDEEKIKGGVTPDLIRVSVGLEDFEDIKHDFEQAFVAVGLKPAVKLNGDPFNQAMSLFNDGFMKDLGTAAPKPVGN
ncbi:pyridoxal phosphate-dependent transferase [Aspergillus cavernicola]|uniref:Pyridoxal phosphate-dependent transferase n=1 Tax=Aspergillus cavernicola TaxID=176166 RepID=A0ABR4HS68_9EURO